MKYYVDIKGKTAGPFDFKQIKNLVENGTVEDTTLYATTESKDWLPISLLLATGNVEEEKAIPTPPVAQPTIVINNQSNNQGFYPYHTVPSGPHKSRVLYQILALFFGPLGIHNFYVGKNGTGLVQLCLSIFTLGYAIPLIWIWNLVEIFVIKTDGNNIPMV